MSNRKFNSLFAKTAFFLALIASLTPAQASVVIYGTRVVFDASKNEHSVTIKNKGKLPALVQSWVSQDINNAPAPFVISPNLTRVEPSAKQSLRIIRTPEAIKKTAKDQESLFYFNLLEIPPKPKFKDGKSHSYLQLSLRTQLKMFYRPNNLKIPRDQATRHITWQYNAKTQQLTARNDSPYYITITKVVANTHKGDLSFTPQTKEQGMNSGMLAPFSSAVFISNTGAIKSLQSLKFTQISDYGGRIEEAGNLLH